MGRARSVFDPAQTRLASVRWTEELPETDRWRQSVGSILGSGGDRVVAGAAKSSPKSANHR